MTDGKRVTGWSSAPLEPGLVQDGLIVAPERVGSVIRTVMAERRMPDRKVIASLTGMRSVPRLLSLPRIPRTLVPEAVRHESERAMPVPLDEMYLFWRELGGGRSRRRFFAVGVPRNLLDAEVQALAHARIRRNVLDLKPMALARMVNRKEAMIINLEPDNADIVLVAEGVPVIMRTLILGGENVAQQDKVMQAAAEASRTLDFYNSSHPEHPIGSETPAFLTGALANDAAFVDLFRGAISNPIENLEPAIQCPPDLPIAEYAVNIGLALKRVVPRGIRRAAVFPALDLTITPDADQPRRRPMRSLLYALLAALTVALLFPAYSAKLDGEVNTAQLEMELGTLRQHLRNVRETLDRMDRVTVQTGQLKEERLAVLGADNDLGNILELVFGALPASIDLTSVTVTNDQMTLGGAAASRSLAIDYASFIEESGLFSTVDIACSIAEDGETDSDVTSFNITGDR